MFLDCLSHTSLSSKDYSSLQKCQSSSLLMKPQILVIKVVLAIIKGTRYLIDVEQMEAACNHSISAKLLLRPFQTQAFHLTRLVES